MSLRSTRSSVRFEKSRVGCGEAFAFPPPRFGFGMGMKNSLGRRVSMTFPVGPLGPISKCRAGSSYAEFSTGLDSAALTSDTEPPSQASPTTAPSSHTAVFIDIDVGPTDRPCSTVEHPIGRLARGAGLTLGGAYRDGAVGWAPSVSRTTGNHGARLPAFGTRIGCELDVRREASGVIRVALPGGGAPAGVRLRRAAVCGRRHRQ